MNNDDIFELARDLEIQFGSQKTEDIRAKDAVLQTGFINAKNEEVVPVGAGHDPMVYKQKFSYLSAIPYLRVNPPKPELADKAEMLENALEGMMALSQGAIDVWRSMVRSAIWSGRGWSKIVCWPDAWGEDFQQKEDEEDGEYNDRLEKLKAENFPLVWIPKDAENRWPTFDARGNLDEVVGIYQMTARAVRKAYGDILMGGQGDRDLVRVIEYDDDKECVTIISDSAMGKSEPREAKRWAHGMGVNPNVFIELEPVPPANDKGIRWTGCSFDGRHARPVIDSILSDALYNFRRDTRAGDDIYLDKEMTEGESPEAGANARSINIAPETPNYFWTTEKHLRVQSAQTNADGWQILSLLLGFSRDMDISDVLKGALKGDETGILYNTAGQLAQKQFDPTIENFKRGAKAIGIRFFRAVKAFAREYEGIKDAPVEIPIIYTSAKGQSYSLSLKPKDIEGWESRIQARLELAIPVNESGQVTVARLATSPDNPLMDIPQAQSRYLGIEDTVQTNANIIRDSVRRAMVPKFVEMIAQNGLQLMNKPSGNLGDLEAVFASFSPAEQQALLRLAEQQGIQAEPTNVAPNMARGMANTVRTGQPQNPTGARNLNAQAY